MTLDEMLADIERKLDLDYPPPNLPPVDPPKSRDDDGGMEDRLRQLEQDVAVIKSNYATKADVAESKATIVLWVAGTFIVGQVLPAILKAFHII